MSGGSDNESMLSYLGHLGGILGASWAILKHMKLNIRIWNYQMLKMLKNQRFLKWFWTYFTNPPASVQMRPATIPPQTPPRKIPWERIPLERINRKENSHTAFALQAGPADDGKRSSDAGRSLGCGTQKLNKK